MIFTQCYVSGILPEEWKKTLVSPVFKKDDKSSPNNYRQSSQIRQNCLDDSTEVTEGVTLTPEIFANKQGATSSQEIFGYN